MARGQKKTEQKNGNGATLGFEQALWASANTLRGHMDAAEYKHVVLGLIFLKYISDAFSELYKIYSQQPHVDPEDRDEYIAENVFWVPKEARWSFLQPNAKQPTIGKLLDEAMDAIEKENPSLKGILPKDYNKPAQDKQLVGELIDLISKIGLGDEASRSKDILGGVYEYFLGQFCTDTYRNEILASATGTTVKHTSPERIKAFEFPFPNNEISIHFEKVITLVYERFSLNNEQSRTLATIRNALLPKLLSGEVQMKDADKYVAMGDIPQRCSHA